MVKEWWIGLGGSELWTRVIGRLLIVTLIAGFQRGDGVFGPLIVKSVDDPNERLYDEDLVEHVIMVREKQYETGRIFIIKWVDYTTNCKLKIWLFYLYLFNFNQKRYVLI